MIRRAAGLVAAGLVAASGAAGAAGEPRSAIPWLSESIRTDVPAPPPRPAGPAPTRGSEEITVTPLGTVRRDSVGLLPPERSGLPRDLWGPTPTGQAESLIRDHPDTGVPAARALFRKILLAETDPPQPALADGALLVARVDRLLEIGALEEARALIELAGPETPELFRRWFDVGLLLDAATAPCDALRQNPALSPTLPARVFCLARGGDWNAAEITLVVGEDVGSIGSDQQALLARFLDPEIFEGEPNPPVPEPLTPLDFLMREATGMPRPAGALPTAFLHHDLVEHAPMRARVAAAERLVLSGGVAPQVLFEAYRAGIPPASGGIWDRAAAVQALDDALAEDADPALLGPALLGTEEALRARGLEVAFAREYAPALADADWSGMVLANHSGLSSDSRTTPRQIVTMLEEAATSAGGADFHELLKHIGWKGVKGSARVKTGTMSYARGLAGYIDTAAGNRLAFAIFFNDMGKRAALDAAFDPRVKEIDPASRPWRTRALKLEEKYTTGWAEQF